MFKKHNKKTNIKPNEGNPEIAIKRLNKKVLVFIVVAFLLLAVSLILVFTLPPKDNGKFEIHSLDLQIDGANVSGQIDKAFTDENFTIDIVINNGNYNDEYRPRVEWKIISENNLNCKINDNGEFTIGNILGSVVVEVIVISRNTLTQQMIVNIVVPENLTLFDINATTENELVFVEGQTFCPTGIAVSAIFINGQNDLFSVFVNDYNYDSEKVLDTSVSDMGITYEYKNIVRHCLIPIIIYPKTLQSIEITSAPNIVNYIEGQQFDTTGLRVVANFEYVILDVTDSVVVNTGKYLTPSNDYIEIYYTYNSVTKSVKQLITVESRILQSLTVASMPEKLHYIQGQYFKKDGLKIVANYEYLTKNVTDLVVFDNTDRLYTSDNEINFTYTENGITKSGKIDIAVEKPYEHVRTIRFSNPYDATLSWLYEYMSDDGVVRVDDTDFINYDNLLFDQENGIYTIPVGATVTILKVSPAVTGLCINEENIEIEYPSNSYEFEVSVGIDDIEIGFNKVIGERITIRFASTEVGQNFAFLYSSSYRGSLSEKDLFQLAQIFEDTAEYYYAFRFGGQDYTFEELANFIFDADTVFVVYRHDKIVENAININVIYPNAMFSVVIEKFREVSLRQLPRIDRVGYNLNFSLTQDGVPITDAEFAVWLNGTENDSVLYAVYTLFVATVTGEIVGAYTYEDTILGISLTIVFNSDGTYRYDLMKRGEENCSFSGVYKDNQDGTYTILSVESKNEYSLVSVDDFTIVLDGDKLETIAFIIDDTNLSVEKIPVHLKK